jgi:hypothetical protein
MPVWVLKETGLGSDHNLEGVTMKAVVIAVGLVASIAGVAKADVAGDALSAKAEDCIRTAAPRVAASSQSLSDAVNFLVSDLCGIEVQHANAYAQSLRSLEQLKATAATTQLAGITIDQATGELTTPPGFTAPLNTTTLMLNAMRVAGGQPPQYRSIAAKAVLAAKSK